MLKIVLIVCLALCVTATNLFAIEVDVNKFTDADKVFVETLFTPKQWDMISEIERVQYVVDKLPCDKQVDKVIEVLGYLNSLLPVYESASKNSKLSEYAKSYFSESYRGLSLLREAFITTTLPELNEVKLGCLNGKITREQVEYNTQLQAWFTNSKNCDSCQKYPYNSVERKTEGWKEFSGLNDEKMKLIDKQFKTEVWNK